ncbi:MAG: c-type cytochrome [Opitutales bacterium]
MTPKNDPSRSDEQLRPHSFDGIQEYDKRLPNWWLLTFYGAIAFWIGYWFYYQRAHIGASDTAVLAQQIAQIEAAKLTTTAKIDDATLWKMSRNPVFVDAGRATFNTTCASCHNVNLTGGIGPNLVDQLWIHGGRPTEIYDTVTNGVPIKGMPTWGPVLGARKITEAVAYILSHHHEGEPILKQDKWVPIMSP